MSLLTPVILGAILGTAYVISVGANDVANALGTAVGSQALSLKSACVIGAVFELLGATLVGGKTSTALADKFLNVESFTPAQFSYSMMSALFGSCIWNIIATYQSLPVSSTHAIIGSLIAVGIVQDGFVSVGWAEVGETCLSWVLSPAVGMSVSFCTYTALSKFVINTEKSLDRAAAVAPILNAMTVSTVAIFTLIAGPKEIRVEDWWVILLTALISFVLSYLLFRLSILPYMQRKGYLTPSMGDGNQFNFLGGNDPDLDDLSFTAAISFHESTTESPKLLQSDSDVKHMKPAEYYFVLPMVMTAASIAFGHGGNDVGNAIGPFSASLYVNDHGDLRGISSHETPILVTFLGGLGIVLGLTLFGNRVMKTVGENITKLTYSKGFAAQYGASVAILACTTLSLPISTTSVLVGSITGVGYVDGGKGVNMTIMKKILWGWIATLPAAGCCAALIYWICKLSGV
jgi:phosphate/sulfate permease